MPIVKPAESEDGTEALAALSDEALVARVATGSRPAFAEIFRRYAGRVKAFLMRSGAAHHEAEEGAQEVMVALWRRAQGFDAERASVSTWLYAMARNKRIDMVRRDRARPDPDPEDPLWQPEEGATAEGAISARERDLRVRAALGTLSEDQLAVVRLAFFAGLSQSEIAERLGTPLGTVKSRLRLSFRRLRDTLGDEFRAELLDE